MITLRSVALDWYSDNVSLVEARDIVSNLDVVNSFDPGSDEGLEFDNSLDAIYGLVVDGVFSEEDAVVFLEGIK